MNFSYIYLPKSLSLKDKKTTKKNVRKINKII